MRVTRSATNPAPPSPSSRATASPRITSLRSATVKKRSKVIGKSPSPSYARSLRASRRQQIKQKEEEVEDSENDVDSQSDQDEHEDQSPKLKSTPLPQRRKLKLMIGEDEDDDAKEEEATEPEPVAKIKKFKVTKAGQMQLKKLKRIVDLVGVENNDKVPDGSDHDMESESPSTSTPLAEETGSENKDKHDADAGPVTVSQNPGPSVSHTPKSNPKPRPPTDPRILKLLGTFEANCELAEQAGLDFIGTQVHHPVISCFRELGKSDITSIVGHSGKFRKDLNQLEMSMLCVGLLDYIAIGIDNPLYYSNPTGAADAAPIMMMMKSGKFDGRLVERIMKNLKWVFLKWSRTKDKRKNRSELVLSYLRSLLEKFQAAEYKDSFSAQIDELVTLAAPLKKPVNKSFNLQQQRPSGVSSPTTTGTTTSAFTDRTNQTPTKTTNNDTDIQILDKDSEPAPAPKAIKRLFPEPVEKETGNQNAKLPDPDSDSPESKKSKIENTNHSQKDEAVADVQILPPAKPAPESPAPVKVIKNAFAMMMGRSRELAKSKDEKSDKKRPKTTNANAKKSSTMTPVLIQKVN